MFNPFLSFFKSGKSKLMIALMGFMLVFGLAVSPSFPVAAKSDTKVKAKDCQEQCKVVTRAETIKLIFAARGLDNQPAYPFQSACQTLDPNTWYFQFVAQAIDEGWISCPSSVYYDWSQPLTKAEFSKIIFSANHLENHYQPPVSPTFTDVPADVWFYDFVEALAQNGLFYYDPLNPVFHPADPADSCFAREVLSRL